MPKDGDPEPGLLLIVETPEAVLPPLDWAAAIGPTAGSRAATVLRLTDAPVDGAAAFLEDRGLAVRVVDGADPLVETMRNIGPAFADVLGQIERATDRDPDFWLSKLSEVYFTRPLWFELIRLAVVAGILDRGRFDRCVAVAGPSFADLVKGLAAERGIDCAVATIGPPTRNESAPAILARVGVKLALNAGREARAWLASRGLPPPGPATTLVFADFPDNWTAGDGSAHSRMTGCLVGTPVGNQSLAYLVCVSRSGRTLLRRASEIAGNAKRARDATADFPLAVAERWGALSDLLGHYLRIGGYLRWLRRARAVARPGAVRFLGVDIGAQLCEGMLDAGLVDAPKNRYFEACVRRAFSATGARTAIVPMYELAFGRTVIRAARGAGARTVAVQHGSLGLAHRWRFSLVAGFLAGEARRALDATPDVLGVEGAPAAEWLATDGFPADRIAVIGAPRLVHAMPRYEPDSVSATVLVLGDLHFWPGMFRWCLDALAGEGFRLILRAHPVAHDDAKRWFAREAGDGRSDVTLSPRKTRLDDQLVEARPLALVVGATGAGLDSALAGWPVGIRRSNWLPDSNPLSAAPGQDVFASADGARFRDWLRRLRDDDAYRRAYAEGCRQAAVALVSETGADAASRLLTLAGPDAPAIAAAGAESG